MDREKSFVYLWDTSYDWDDNVIKLGVSHSLADRQGTYRTGNYRPGNFMLAFEVPRKCIKPLDNHLKYHFRGYHRYIPGGGTEYYDRAIISQLEPHLQTLNLRYRVLSMDEIRALKRKERAMDAQLYSISENALWATQQVLKRLDVKKMVRRLKIQKQMVPPLPPPQHQGSPPTPTETAVVPSPLPYQQAVLDRMYDFYEQTDKGRLNWACGLGKTLLSIFSVAILGCKTVLYGVPSIELQAQLRDEILKIYPTPENILLIGGENGKQQVGVDAWLQQRIDTTAPRFVITTYHSCWVLVKESVHFDFKVGDEAHHLVGALRTEEDRGFRLFHKLPATKTLFMTATEKIMDTPAEGEQVYSMDDPAVFGERLDEKTVQWAIENKKITDYNLCILKSTEDELNRILSQVQMDVSNPLLFISCFMCLKTINGGKGTTHLLLYTNTTADAELAESYIQQLLKYDEKQASTGGAVLFPNIKRDQMYNRALHSRLRGFHLKTEVALFKQAVYGIIPCIYIFGEGFNLPKLTGVCVSANMQSVIRIIQSLLRPNRLDHENPHKVASIIVPYIETEKWSVFSDIPVGRVGGVKPFENIMTIAYQLRNVDANMEQKIRVLTLCEPDPPESENAEKRRQPETSVWREWKEDVTELNQLKLRLKKSKVLPFDFSEERDEYEYVKKINRSLKITSITEYHQSQPQHKGFVPNPEEYFRKRGVWTDLYDFMATDTSGFLPTKEEWQRFCQNNRIDTLEKYREVCNQYGDILPKEPNAFYPGFTNILAELAFMKRRR